MTRPVLALAVLLAATAPLLAQHAPKPLNLRCEYHADPLGVDTPAPRLSWQMPLISVQRGQAQTAYHILVATSTEQLAKNTGDLWDSGKVDSDQSLHIPYAGKPLSSRQLCYWKLKTWDQAGRASAWSDAASWTMGIIEPDQWHARWIGAPEAGLAAPQLRATFDLPSKPVRAIARICGLGLHELRLNGVKASDHLLAPAFTDYNKRALYITHDVTEHLRPGPNAIGVILGGGWYRLASRDFFGFEKAPWTGPPRLLLELELLLADGTRLFIASDETWKWSTGEIVFNCLRAGETIDARQLTPNWDTADYDDTGWSPVTVLPAPAGRLAAQQQPPIRAARRVRPAAITEPAPGVYVIDMGVTFAGHVRLTTRGRPGHTITLKHNEKLQADGFVDMKHLSSHTLDKRFQTEQFILAGTGVETFEPRFTYHGFRYVQIEGLANKPSLDDIQGVLVHNTPAPAGAFACSDPKLNRLQELIVHTQLCNLHSIPTDCPHREKMGWLQDGCVTQEAAICNLDMATFYAKWLHDILDAQDPGGHVPSIAPNSGWASAKPDGGPGRFADPWWATAISRTPWNLYIYYGDRRAVEQAYDGIKAYIDYLSVRSTRAYGSLGDWLEADTQNRAKRTPIPLTGIAAYQLATRQLSRMAAILGRTEDAQKYGTLADEIRASWIQRYVDETGVIVPDSQTAYALALELDLLSAHHRSTVAAQLTANIAQRRGHLSTGIIGTHYLPYALSNSGQVDLAFDVLTAEGQPGYFHMIDSGATALWEQWDGNNSLCHPTFGAVGAWFYQPWPGSTPIPPPRDSNGSSSDRTCRAASHGRRPTTTRCSAGSKAGGSARATHTPSS